MTEQKIQYKKQTKTIRGIKISNPLLVQDSIILYLNFLATCARCIKTPLIKIKTHIRIVFVITIKIIGITAFDKADKATSVPAYINDWYAKKTKLKNDEYTDRFITKRTISATSMFLKL